LHRKHEWHGLALKQPIVVGQDSEGSRDVPRDAPTAFDILAFSVHGTAISLSRAAEECCLVLDEYRHRLIEPIPATLCCASSCRRQLRVIFTARFPSPTSSIGATRAGGRPHGPERSARYCPMMLSDNGFDAVTYRQG
jgi:hypothetical protein